MMEAKTFSGNKRSVSVEKIIGLVAFFLLVSPACPAHGDGPDNDRERLMVCLPAFVESLDPTNYRNRTTQVVLKNIFDSLTTRDRNMSVVPQLAESWRSLDENTWEFKLKKGVKFHNGDELTALDVKFTLDRVTGEKGLDGRASPRRGLFSPISEVMVVDPLTVRIMTAKPWPILPLMLTLQEIVPMKYMKTVGSEGFARHPVGCGPFEFVAAEDRKRLLLRRFEGYYGGSAFNPPVQVAPLKEVVFEVASGMNEQIAKLKKGRLDIVFNLPAGAVPILGLMSDIHLARGPATRSYFADINCLKPPYDDIRVRQALNHAIDKKTVVEKILYGHGQVLPTVVLPGAFAYNTRLKPYAYNPVLARKMLKESGVPKQKKIILTCQAEDRLLADNIAFFLTRVGLRPELTLFDANRPKSLGPKGEWDLFVSSWGNSTLEPSGILQPKFMSQGAGNFSGYANPEVDDLLARAAGTGDSKTRAAAYEKIQEIIYEQAPMIFVYAADELFGLSTRVKNFFPSASGMINLHDVYLDR